MRLVSTFFITSFITWAAIGFVGVFTAQANEFDNSGPYLALDAGLVLQPDPVDLGGTVSSGGTSVTYSVALSMSPGFAVGGRLGYKFRSGWRIEGELGYRRNSYDSIIASAGSNLVAAPLGGSIPVEGNNAALLYMINFYYEFAIADRWLPHAGVGIGGVTTFFDLSGNPPQVTSLINASNRTRFGFQLAGGLGFAIDPKTVVSVDYRYLESVEPENLFVFAFGGYDYRSHGILLGIRRHF